MLGLTACLSMTRSGIFWQPRWRNREETSPRRPIWVRKDPGALDPLQAGELPRGWSWRRTQASSSAGIAREGRPGRPHWESPPERRADFLGQAPGCALPLLSYARSLRAETLVPSLVKEHRHEHEAVSNRRSGQGFAPKIHHIQPVREFFLG